LEENLPNAPNSADTQLRNLSEARFWIASGFAEKLGVISPLADFTLSNMSVLDSRHSAIAVVH
jgi:hypothetical protein